MFATFFIIKYNNAVLSMENANLDFWGKKEIKKRLKQAKNIIKWQYSYWNVPKNTY